MLQPKKKQTGFLSLPYEIINEILQYCYPIHRCIFNLALTCKSIHDPLRQAIVTLRSYKFYYKFYKSEIERIIESAYRRIFEDVRCCVLSHTAQKVKIKYDFLKSIVEHFYENEETYIKDLKKIYKKMVLYSVSSKNIIKELKFWRTLSLDYINLSKTIKGKPIKDQSINDVLKSLIIYKYKLFVDITQSEDMPKILPENLRLTIITNEIMSTKENKIQAWKMLFKSNQVTNISCLEVDLSWKGDVHERSAYFCQEFMKFLGKVKLKKLILEADDKNDFKCYFIEPLAKKVCQTIKDSKNHPSIKFDIKKIFLNVDCMCVDELVSLLLSLSSVNKNMEKFVLDGDSDVVLEVNYRSSSPLTPDFKSKNGDDLFFHVTDKISVDNKRLDEKIEKHFSEYYKILFSKEMINLKGFFLFFLPQHKKLKKFIINTGISNYEYKFFSKDKRDEDWAKDMKNCLKEHPSLKKVIIQEFSIQKETKKGKKQKEKTEYNSKWFSVKI